MIKCKNLARDFLLGEQVVQALRGVSIDVEKGEFVAVMGPTGSGKSTLLYQLGLIDRPTSGKIIIDKVDVLNLNHEQRTKFRLDNMGFVFQFYSLLPEMNAIENVALPALLRGLDRKTAFSKASKLLVELNLKDRLLHYPVQLSGGEMQRVAIARALVNNPKIVFADEPTANLDFKTGSMVVDTFRKLNRELGQTIVMVTHERPFGKKADRIIELKDGQVV